MNLVPRSLGVRIHDLTGGVSVVLGLFEYVSHQIALVLQELHGLAKGVHIVIMLYQWERAYLINESIRPRDGLSHPFSGFGYEHHPLAGDVRDLVKALELIRPARVERKCRNDILKLLPE
jgi:hypothetical protein